VPDYHISREKLGELAFSSRKRRCLLEARAARGAGMTSLSISLVSRAFNEAQNGQLARMPQKVVYERIPQLDEDGNPLIRPNRAIQTVRVPYQVEIVKLSGPPLKVGELLV